MKKILVVSLLLLLTSTSWAQKDSEGHDTANTAAVEALLQEIPADYRSIVHKYTAELLSQRDGVDSIRRGMNANTLTEEGGDLTGTHYWRWLAFSFVLNKPEGRAFLIKKLEEEPDSTVRVTILEAIGGKQENPKSRLSAAERETVSKLAASDPDPSVALAALSTLRDLHHAEEGELLAARRKLNDSSSLRDAYWQRYAYFGEVRNPAFNYSAPPVFNIASRDKPIRVLAFGDFGTGSAGQIKDAATMVTYNQQHPFDFGLALGDNFYENGLTTPSDPRWQTEWEQLYGPLGIKFYPVLGNHDYSERDSPAAELAYTAKSKTWVFPAAYYTFTAGAAQFFAIDNIRLTDEELTWLDTELNKSTAKWKIVYGHYQIYDSSYGDNNETQVNLIGRLLPILEKNHVQIYLNGHSHNMQATQTASPVHFFTSGAGGRDLYDMDATYKKTIFRDRQFGFTVVEADPQHVDVIFVDEDGKEVYRSHITD